MRSRRMTPPAPRWPSSRVYSRSVNGAQALINTLVDGGVDVCFANPGTSEMHFVAALDAVPQMRGVLRFSRASPPARPTAMRASRTDRPRCCCIWAPDWAMVWPTCTTPVAPTSRWWSSSATTPPITRSTTPHWNPTSTRSPAACRAGCAGRLTLPTSRPMPPRRSPPAGAGSQIATLMLPADMSWTDGAQPASASPAQPTGADPTLDAVEVAARGAAVRRAHGDPDRRRRHPRRGLTAAARIADGHRRPLAVARHSRRGWSAGPASPPSTGSPTSPRLSRPNSTAPSI